MTNSQELAVGGSAGARRERHSADPQSDIDCDTGSTIVQRSLTTNKKRALCKADKDKK